jgi:hypothetical protein
MYTPLRTREGGIKMSGKEICLTPETQEYLQKIIKAGVHNSHVITRARVLLMLDRTGKTDHVRYKRTAENANISVQAVYNMRDEYLANQDIESYLNRKKRDTPPRAQKIDGKAEAQIIALACGEPPKGYSKWTVRLLRDKAVELHFVDGLSHMTIQRLLKKRNISLT